MNKIFQFSYLDTHEERDYLIANIYPKLKDYCKKEYGIDFQVQTFEFQYKPLNSK